MLQEVAWTGLWILLAGGTSFFKNEGILSAVISVLSFAATDVFWRVLRGSRSVTERAVRSLPSLFRAL